MFKITEKILFNCLAAKIFVLLLLLLSVYYFFFLNYSAFGSFKWKPICGDDFCTSFTVRLFCRSNDCDGQRIEDMNCYLNLPKIPMNHTLVFAQQFHILDSDSVSFVIAVSAYICVCVCVICVCIRFFAQKTNKLARQSRDWWIWMKKSVWRLFDGLLCALSTFFCGICKSFVFGNDFCTIWLEHLFRRFFFLIVIFTLLQRLSLFECGFLFKF